MNWFASNWIWLALGAGALALFAVRGGCGIGHGRHEHRRQGDENRKAGGREAASAPLSTRAGAGDSGDMAPQPAYGAESGKRASPAAAHGHGDSSGRASPHRHHHHGC